jgi:hypothetical protein
MVDQGDTSDVIVHMICSAVSVSGMLFDRPPWSHELLGLGLRLALTAHHSQLRLQSVNMQDTSAMGELHVVARRAYEHVHLVAKSAVMSYLEGHADLRSTGNCGYLI